MSEIVKRYKTDDLTIVWKPGKCIHAAECVKALPNVYKPDEKPWLTPENATKDELVAQIDKCPSGALSYEGAETTSPSNSISVNFMKNGPMLVNGHLQITNSDGSKIEKSETTAFCRCGASANKPYCDGAHVKCGFEG